MDSTYILTANGELCHAGIKGMKWGVRRYQNKDGSLTPAGKKRYNREADRGGYDREGYNGTRYKQSKKGNVEKLYADPDRYVREDRERAKRVADESRNMTNTLKNINDKAIRNQPKPQMNLSNMTDKEMRDQINRAMLERQYNDMFAPKNTSRGKERVSEVLEVAGDVLAVTSSALGIALAITQLMKGG